MGGPPARIQTPPKTKNIIHKHKKNTKKNNKKTIFSAVKEGKRAAAREGGARYVIS